MQKNLFIYIALLSSLFLTLSSCEEVEDPVLEVPGDGGGDVLDWELCPDVIPSEYQFPEFIPVSNPEQDVLLEDFTGHTCANCPEAAEVASDLEDAYPGRVHVASVHAGPGNGFQQVQAGYPTDFTTQAGDDYVDQIDPPIFGNPAGTINRLGGGPTGGIWFLPDQWPTKTDEALALEPRLSIQMEAFHCPQSHGLFVHSAIESEVSLDPSEYRYIIYLLRQKVISPQSDGSQTIEDYEHHNVLSDNINGSWGTAISPDTLAVEQMVELNHSYQLPDPALDSTYQVSNLALLGFVVDRQSEEVIQSQFLELD
ncbi:MAG: Omp28-related outer membrane protein [Flavobacteriales bacterium]|nr:Omp28-related outer membrane protein [Flavobacteriales bacterium]